MDVRRCIICSAIVGLCLHTATEPYDAPHLDPPQPQQFVIPAVTIALSTASRLAALADDGSVVLRSPGWQTTFRAQALLLSIRSD